MTPARQRKGSAEPTKAPQVQPRPAEPARRRVLDPANRDGEFLPNPAPRVREGRQGPTERHLKVVGPKEVGGVRAPGWVVMELTDAQLNALLAGSHVEDWTGVEGWGSQDTPEPETDPDGAQDPSEPEPDQAQDPPMLGTEKEGS
jgi:hypothetical protein